MGVSYDNEMRVLVGMWVGGYVAAYVQTAMFRDVGTSL